MSCFKPTVIQVDSPSVGEAMGRIEYNIDVGEYIFIPELEVEYISVEELEEVVKELKRLTKEYS